MSNIITFKLELQDRYGSAKKVFWKEVKSNFTPSKDMVFSGSDYTLEPRNVYFMDSGDVIVRFVEKYNKDDDWNFLLKEGWTL